MNDFQAGKLIKRLRREKDLTMVAFAKKIDLSQPSLSRIENGNQEITFTLLHKICSALNIRMGDFLYELEGQSKFQIGELNNESDFDLEELDSILQNIILSLSIDQKKGLYSLLLPYIEE